MLLAALGSALLILRLGGADFGADTFYTSVASMAGVMIAVFLAIVVPPMTAAEQRRFGDDSD